ncbi:MAG: hypothetical protein JO115_00025 [Pseudonocardiales bacterium]|nr:hypothetical protein [Pseudonocardiales bacterium]
MSTRAGHDPAPCGARGFVTVMVDQRGEQIVLDRQLTGGYGVILDEAGAAALCGLLRAWLTGRGVEIG